MATNRRFKGYVFPGRRVSRGCLFKTGVSGILDSLPGRSYRVSIPKGPAGYRRTAGTQVKSRVWGRGYLDRGLLSAGNRAGGGGVCSASNGATCGVLDRGYKALASRQGWALTLTLRRSPMGYYWVMFPRLPPSGLVRWVGVDADTPGMSVTILSRRATHDGLQKAHASKSVKRPVRAPVQLPGGGV